MAKPGNLIVKIRCVHQKYGDFNTEVNLEWLVQDLKSHLGDVYPSKPAPSMQRLVYAGQLMKDNEKVASYLQRLPEIELPIIHLVYTPNVIDQQQRQKTPPKPATISEAEAELRRRKPILTSPNGENNQNSVPNFQTGENSNAQAASGPPNFGSYGAPGQFYPSNFNQTSAAGFLQPHQMNPYMNQYFQYLQQLYGPVYWPYGFNSPLAGAAAGSGFMSFNVPQMFPGTNFATGIPPANVAPPVGTQAAAQNLPQQAPQAPQRDLAMNAQGGVADDDEEGRNRDWLDHVYTAARVSLLFIILYSYSSMERLTFVVICCALLYAFQAGWFTRRRPPAAAAAAANRPQPNAQPNPNPNPAAAAAQGDENRAPPNAEAPNDQTANQNSTTVNSATNQNPTPQSAWNVFWSTCYIFISSFFASLIPERPPPVNIN